MTQKSYFQRVAELTPTEFWINNPTPEQTNLALSRESAMPDGDGVPNLLNYALGLDPLAPATNPIVGDINTGYLRLTVPRNPTATDVSFHVEVADNMSAPAWGTNGTTVDIDTPELLQVHNKTAVAESPGGYIRLRVSRP